jgi:hypothetical protein
MIQFGNSFIIGTTLMNKNITFTRNAQRGRSEYINICLIIVYLRFKSREVEEIAKVT